MILVGNQRSYTIGKIIRGILSATPLALLNSYNAAMTSVLAAELSERHFDIVQLEGIEMSPYLDVIEKARHRPKRIVLNWHNVESELTARHALHGRTFLHRIYMRMATTQLRSIERELLHRCDLHLVTSQRERDLLLRLNPGADVLVTENGVDMASFLDTKNLDHEPSEQRNRVLFVGSMDYSANIDAILNFSLTSWADIHRQFPALRLTVVGRNPPKQIRELSRRPGIEITGAVPDVRPYYDQAFAVVVPLRVGGGTRLKVIEALAARVPVLSTAVGVEGLRLEPGRHFRLAESPLAFYREISNLSADHESWRRMATEGWKLAQTYDWPQVCSRLSDVYRDFLQSRPDLHKSGSGEGSSDQTLQLRRRHMSRG